MQGHFSRIMTKWLCGSSVMKENNLKSYLETVNVRVHTTRKVYILVVQWLGGSSVDFRVYSMRKVYILVARRLGGPSVDFKVYRARKVYILVARWFGSSSVTIKLPSHLKLILLQKWPCIL